MAFMLNDAATATAISDLTMAFMVFLLVGFPESASLAWGGS
jgi:hypothetical protein